MSKSFVSSLRWFLFVVVVWTSQNWAFADPPLAYRWEKNQQFYVDWYRLRSDKYRNNFQITEKMDDQRLVARFKVVKILPQNGVELEMQIGLVQNRAKGAFVDPWLKKMEGTTFTITLDEQQKVTRLEGHEFLAKQAAGTDQGQKYDLVNNTLQQTVKFWLESIFYPVASATGDKTWTRPGEVGNTTFLELDKTYTLGKKAGKDKWTIQVGGQFAPTKEQKNPGGLTGLSLQIPVQDFNGTLIFDAKKGLPVEGHVNVKLELAGPRSASNKNDVYIALTWTETTLFCSENPLTTPAPARTVKIITAAQSKEITNSLGMKLVAMPAGKFTMGAPAGTFGRSDFDEEVEVEIRQPFHMAAHEVTIAQYRQFVEATGYRTVGEQLPMGCFGYNKETKKIEMHPSFSWKNPGWDVNDQHPACFLSWDDAKAFCAWLSKKEGKHYRLPTEAEWEYACRAGKNTTYSFGNDEDALKAHGNVMDASTPRLFPSVPSQKWEDGYPFTAPVGSFQANAFGLYDMHGNALEWCEDYIWYHSKKYLVDPVGPSFGVARVQRGGGWCDIPNQCTTYRRAGADPSLPLVSSGFRVVLTPVPVTQVTAEPTWVGRQVLPRHTETTFASTMLANAPREMCFAVPVAQEKLGVLRVWYGGQVVHVFKEDAILLEDAVAYYTDKIKDSPRDTGLLLLRAAAWKGLAQPDFAIDDLNKVLELQPQNVTVLLERAKIWCQGKDFVKARADLEAAVKHEPNNAWTHEALGWFLATCPQDSERNGKAALEHARRAKELTPFRSSAILETLAAAHAELGDFELAGNLMRDAMIDPNYMQRAGDRARTCLELYRRNQAYRHEP